MKNVISKTHSLLTELSEEGLLDADANDLCGACAIGSYFLMKKLRKKGIEAELYVSNCQTHCWVQVGKKVIDVTVQQFGHPKKFFIGKSHKYYNYLGKKVTRLRNFDCWPYEQDPRNKPVLQELEKRWYTS